MRARGVTQEIAFACAPHPEPNDKVAVHVPATFDARSPVTICVFLHGREGDVPFEDHIRQAIDQIAACSANVALVAPRFGAEVQAGSFEDSAGFPSFISELQATLPGAAEAPIVLAVFSGGWRPLSAILNGLLAQPSLLADRIKGLLLLDCVYGPISSAAVVAWQKQRRAQTALLSIYGRDTADNAPAANRALIEALKETGPVQTTMPRRFPPGTAAVVEVATPHLDIVSDGPPASPIATFLGGLNRPARGRPPIPTSDDRTG
jgi:hypothetical protein